MPSSLADQVLGELADNEKHASRLRRDWAKATSQYGKALPELLGERVYGEMKRDFNEAENVLGAPDEGPFQRIREDPERRKKFDPLQHQAEIAALLSAQVRLLQNEPLVCALDVLPAFVDPNLRQWERTIIDSSLSVRVKYNLQKRAREEVVLAFRRNVASLAERSSPAPTEGCPKTFSLDAIAGFYGFLEDSGLAAQGKRVPLGRLFTVFHGSKAVEI